MSEELRYRFRTSADDTYALTYWLALNSPAHSKVRYQATTWVLCLSFLISIAIASALKEDGVAPALAFLIAGVGVGVGAWFAYPTLIARNAARRSAVNPAPGQFGDYSLEVNDSSLSLEAEHSKSTWLWTAFTSVSEPPGFLMLWGGQTVLLAVPQRSSDAADVLPVVEFIRKNVQLRSNKLLERPREE